MEKKQFAKFVRQTKKQRNLTFNRFADAIGVHWTTVYRWSIGQTVPAPNVIEYWVDRIERIT